MTPGGKGFETGGPRIKYVLCPGKVISNTDGGTHFITADRLAWLYQVPMSECAVMHDSEATWRGADVKFLHPRYDGKYPVFAERKRRGETKA